MRPPPVSITKNRMSSGTAEGKRNRGRHFIASVCVRGYAWTPVELFFKGPHGRRWNFSINPSKCEKLSLSLYLRSYITKTKLYRDQCDNGSRNKMNPMERRRRWIVYDLNFFNRSHQNHNSHHICLLSGMILQFTSWLFANWFFLPLLKKLYKAKREREKEREREREREREKDESMVAPCTLRSRLPRRFPVRTYA